MVRLHPTLSSDQAEAMEGAIVAAHGTHPSGAPEQALLSFVRSLRAAPSGWCEVPASAHPSLGRVLSRMILDGVMEIDTDGGVVGGLHALDRIFVSPQRTIAAASEAPPLQMARRALESVQAAVTRGPEGVATALYMYGRRPVTPASCRALPTPAHVLRLLDMDEGSPRARRASTAWSPMPLPRAPDDWISWRRATTTGHFETPGITYKLYVCPTREGFRATFEPAVIALARHAAIQFKIGSGSFALARPDKFVAYFQRRSDLEACMAEIDRSLAGHEAHPLPFAASPSPTGIVSWGVDFAMEPGSEEQVSWRWWLCERLARYLCSAHEQGAAREMSVDFALLRLSLDDVEIASFAPSDRLLLDVAASVLQAPVRQATRA